MPRVAQVVGPVAVYPDLVLADPDALARVGLGVQRPHPARADDDVVDVGAAVADRDGVQHVPAVPA